MARIWDGQKMADMVARKAELDTEFSTICDSLHQQYNSDGWDSDDAKMEGYTRDQMRHGQLQRELEHVNNEILSLENFRPETVKEKQDAPFSRFIRKGYNGLTSEEQKEQVEADLGDDAEVGPGYQRFVIRPEDEFSSAMPTMSNGNLTDATRSDDGSGQVLNPLYTRPSVIDELKFFGGVSRMAYNFSTGQGNEYRIPAHDDTDQEGELLSTQNAEVAQNASGKLDDFSFIKFDASTMSSKPVYITREMINDSIVDIAGFANARIVRRMGRGWDKQFTTGGSRKTATVTAGAFGDQSPTGMVGVKNVAQVSSLIFAKNDTVTYDEMVNVEYAVERAYRTGSEMGEGGLSAEGGGRTGWLISDSAEKVLRQLKDSDGRPLWMPQVSGSLGISNRSPSINGFPYEVSGSMDAFGTDKNIPILFGNFSYYGIRTVAAIEVFRFQDSRTMQRNAVEFLGFSRRFARPMVKGVSGRGPGAANTVAIYLGIPQIVAPTLKKQISAS